MTAVRKSEPSETATLGPTTNDAGTAAHTGVPNAESALHSCRRDTSGEPLTTSAEPPPARDPVPVLRFLASEARLDGDLTPGEAAMCDVFDLAADLLADPSRVGVGEGRRLADAVATLALAMYDEAERLR